MPHTLDELLEYYWNDDYEGSKQLAELTAHDPSVVATLLAGLHGEDEDVRLGCISVLGDLGPQARSALPELVKIIQRKNADFNVLFEACSSLRRTGKVAIPPLIQLSKDANTAVRHQAVYELKHCNFEQDGVVEALLDAFRDDDANVRLEAVAFLEENEAKRTSTVCKKVEAGLESSEARTRVYAAQCLLRVMASHQAAIWVAVAGLREGDAEVRVAAVEALAKTKGDVDETTIKTLAGALRDSYPEVRGAAALCLYEFGEHAAPAVAELVAALGDDHPPVHEWATAALSHLGPLAAPAIPAMMAALEKIIAGGLPVGELVPAFQLTYLLRALGEMGSAAQEAQGVLQRAAVRFKKLKEIRETALWALEQVTLEA